MQMLFESDQCVDLFFAGSEDAKRVGEWREGLCFNRFGLKYWGAKVHS